MRVSMVPGILKQVVVNQDRFDEVRLFEFGRIYYKDPERKPEDTAAEEKRLVLAYMPPDVKFKGELDDSPLFKKFFRIQGFFDRAAFL